MLISVAGGAKTLALVRQRWRGMGRAVVGGKKRADRLSPKNSIVTWYKYRIRRLAHFDWEPIRYNLRHLAVLFSTKRYCPGCLGKNVRKSVRRGFLDYCIMPIFLQRPFRCELCDDRFYGPFFAARVENKISDKSPQDNPTKP